MKTIKTIIIAGLAVVALISCGGGASDQKANAEGFTVIENELKNEFGDNAFYTDLKILYIDGFGNVVNTTVTDDPESLKMGEWNLSQNTWKQNSEITLEVPEGAQASDFMFQLDDNINLAKLGELVEKSSKQLIAEKNIENPKLELAYVDYPDNGDISKAEYYINLKPENGGTSFRFTYKLNGDLIEMDY